MRYVKLDITIAISCLVFITVLVLSAWWDPSIRWLHFFQAWLYLAIIGLTYYKSRWGYFLGIATAGFWNYTVLCVNTFFQAGREQLSILLSTGQLPRPDLIISVPAVAAHFVMIGCCLWSYSQLPGKGWRDAGRAVASTMFSVGYFALIMALFQPRYLVLFTRLFHPHLNL